MDSHRELNNIKFIHKMIKKYTLNLNGLTVFTEAATNAYKYTPIIAAMSGAKTFAFSRDNEYGTRLEAINQVSELEESIFLQNKITYIYQRQKQYLEVSDIITNTGNVRPIDAKIIDYLK